MALAYPLLRLVEQAKKRDRTQSEPLAAQASRASNM
jgi:hypothetical protein